MLRSVLILVVLLFTFNAFAADRVIVLAPAAADILQKLGSSSQIVGKTKSVEEFPNALKVGSHIRPNLEIIMSLKPDLIIISSNRFFTEAMVNEAGVPVLEYNPTTLEGILNGIGEIGKVLNKTKQANDLIYSLQMKLDKVKSLNIKPTVVFEIMQIPYTVAGQKNIVADIVEKAGGGLSDQGY